MALNDATLPNVIADVGGTLRQLLRDQIADLSPEGRVVFDSPAEAEVTTDPRVGLFLYQVIETPEMRNQPPVGNGPAGLRRYQTLDLFYLVAPYTQQMEDGHRLLGRVMRVLFDNAVLQGSILQGSLADIGQALRILLHPLSVEEVSQLWGLFPNKPYRLSVAYQVTPVKLFGGPIGEAGQVITREHRYAQIVER